jgi:hypothetical protein
MFKVFYADGSTYTGDAFDAPAWGVLLIAETDKDHGRRIVSNGDYYVWEERWRAKDFVGLIDYLAQPGPRKVLIGRMVDNEIWNETFKRANEDADFPARTGYGFHEVNVNP